MPMKPCLALACICGLLVALLLVSGAAPALFVPHLQRDLIGLLAVAFGLIGLRSLHAQGEARAGVGDHSPSVPAREPTEIASLVAANARMSEALRQRQQLLDDQLRRHAGQLENLAGQHTLELRRSRDLLRIVFDNLPEGLLLLHSDGTLLAANNSFCRLIVGRLPRQVVGQSYRLLWQELARQSELELTSQGPSESGAPLIPDEGVAFHREAASWRVLGTDLVGQQRWYTVNRIPVVGPQGELSQYLECWKDITHQEELQRRLLLTEQMTSLGRLAASVAHEVGNPLQSAMGCLELCGEDGSLSAGSREYLDLALGELRRLSRTMDGLRNLYRPPQISWEQVDLNQIVLQVAQFTGSQFNKSQVCLELALDPQLPPISGQPDALRQVLLNLLLNAQQAMLGGGTISLSTHQKPTDRACRVVVQDTGIGMGLEQLRRLFEPFHSGKAQGVGLGLYLCRQIIEQHAGQIEVTSQPGQGTLITVLLPWSEARPAHNHTSDHQTILK